MTEESGIVCGKELRKYLFVIGALAALILVGSYWYVEFYDKKEGLISLSAVDSVGPLGGAPQGGVGMQAAMATPMTVAASPFRDVAAALQSSVVNISATRAAAGAPSLPQTRAPQGGVGFADPFTGVGIQSIGSGIIVSQDGYILTNFHVVEKASEIYVTVFLPQGGTSRNLAEVVRLSERLDLALLKIAPDAPLTPAALGSSDQIQVGDPVIAMGSPFGLDQTVSQGIVSGKRKSIVIEGVNHTNLIQSDAAINQGNSGGALVDNRGYVIGVNTAIYTPTGAFAGVGFAVPSNDARDFIDEAIQLPNVRPNLKAARKQMANAMQAALPAGAPPPISANAPVPGNHKADGRANMPCTTCHQITGAPAGGQAMAAAAIGGGAPPITANAPTPGNHKADGRANMPCATCHQITGAAAAGQPMQAAQFATSPGGAVGMNAAVAGQGGQAPLLPGQIAGRTVWMGAEVQPINQMIAKQFQSPVIDGAFVNSVYPGSPAQTAGVQPGDIVFKMDGRWIYSPDHLLEVVGSFQPGDSVRLSVYRNGQRQNLYLTVGQAPAVITPPLGSAPQPMNQPGTMMGAAPIPNEFEWRGMELDPITPAVIAKDPVLTGKVGTVVADVTPNTPGAYAGFIRNDIILSINGVTVGSPEALNDAINQAATAEGAVVYLERSGQTLITTVAR